MADVLHHPRKPNGHSYYSDAPLKRNTSSYSSFLSQAASPFPNTRPSPPTPPTSNNTFSFGNLHSSSSSTDFRSMQSIGDLSSLPPTPASSVSLDEDGERSDDEEDIAFPSYDRVRFFHSDVPLDLPPSPSDESEIESVNTEQDEEEEEQNQEQEREPSVATQSTHSNSPLPTPTVDDTAVKPNPSRHVDYLSHEWREEDIWHSWRHIVSQRKVYGQRSRLENASWRTWAKSKYRLATVSPETLNWLKESDVTWLYGPLQQATSHPVTQSSRDTSPARSSNAARSSKKPILKKRSMSEVMLQRSLSASSLLKQAAASIQAQQGTRPGTPFIRRSSDFNSAKQSTTISRDQLDYFSTIPSSDGATPCENGKRHIRFDDKVEQCIAVDAKPDPYDTSSDEDDGYDTSEDEVELVMRKRRRRPTMAGQPAPRTSQSPPKIIEKLPDTTLKGRVEPPEPAKPASFSLPFTRTWGTNKLNQSPSQETIRPSNPTRNFLLAADDSDDEQDVTPETSWSPSDAFAVNQIGSPTNVDDEYRASADSMNGPSNMRRTPSGMFMPYDDDEDDAATEMGLFGRVSETINTARDIAHVIWNVGWRK